MLPASDRSPEQSETASDGARYREALYWRMAHDPKRLALVNLLGLLALPFSAATFGALAAGLAKASPVALDAGSEAATVLVTVGVLFATVIVHEGTHGAAIRLCGNRPFFGFQWAGLVPYATAPGQRFTRNQYVAVALAPLAVLSAVGLGSFLVLPASSLPWLVFALVINAAGSVGDVWMSLVALRYPRSARVVDERDGLRILVRD